MSKVEEYNKVKENILLGFDDLQNKIKAKTATKEEYDEYQRLSRAKENLPKIENLFKYKEKLETFLDDVDEELAKRENLKAVNKEIEKLDKKMSEIEKESMEIESNLKDPNLKEEKKEELKSKKDKLMAERDENNKNYSKKQEELKSYLGKDNGLNEKTDKELNALALNVSSRISKCNMATKNLLRGKSWDAIDCKLENWNEPKKYTGRKKQELNIFDPEEVEKFFSKKEEENNKLDLTFADKHPRLARIGKFFRNIANRITGKKEESAKTPKKEEPKKEEPKEKVSEEELGLDKDFRAQLKELAEKGMDGMNAEEKAARQEVAKAKLEEMRKANRETEANKFGKKYADKSDYRNKEDDGSR